MNPNPMNSRTVLIVEDNQGMRKILKTVLMQMGIRNIVEATNGVEALHCLRAFNMWSHPIPPADVSVPERSANSGQIDLIVSDWAMPKMDGHEFLWTLRQEPMMDRIPFVMLTAENERENILAAVELNVSDYVVKPFTHDVLEQKIRAILE